jgi:DNA-binding transcriptional LysR family regulator
VQIVRAPVGLVKAARQSCQYSFPSSTDQTGDTLAHRGRRCPIHLSLRWYTDLIYNPRPMDLRRVKAFIAVAETLSVTKAAERLHISQPPLSRHIHQLEEELGVTLFVRHRHGVTLTEAGKRLLEKARALEAAASEFALTARHVCAAEANEIRVGIGWGLWDVVNRIRVEFARTYPDVTIAATDAYCWYDSNEQLRTGALDLAFARPPFDAGFEVSAPILHERIQAIVSDVSPLAARETVSVRELASEPLLLWDRQIAPTLYDQILDLYARAGVEPRMLPTPGAGPFNHAGMMLVASGKGVYLGYGVPLTEPQPPSGVAVRPLSDRDATTEVRVVHRKAENSPVVRRFLECVWCMYPPQEQYLPVAAGGRQ